MRRRRQTFSRFYSNCRFFLSTHPFGCPWLDSLSNPADEFDRYHDIMHCLRSLALVRLARSVCNRRRSIGHQPTRCQPPDLLSLVRLGYNHRHSADRLQFHWLAMAMAKVLSNAPLLQELRIGQFSDSQSLDFHSK